MTRHSILQEKSFLFAIHIVGFCRDLSQQKEFVLAKQLLKSGTSIGANVEEAMHAQSRPDFISKLSISYKEAAEADFWLRLLIASNIQKEKAITLRDEVVEIRRDGQQSTNRHRCRPDR